LDVSLRGNKDLSKRPGCIGTERALNTFKILFYFILKCMYATVSIIIIIIIIIIMLGINGKYVSNIHSSFIQ
jgi:hypothetical protein